MKDKKQPSDLENFKDKNLELFNNILGEVVIKEKRTGVTIRVSPIPKGRGLRIITNDRVEPVLITPHEENTWLVTPHPKK